LNGPSVMVRLPPETRTRAPFEVGWSPSRARSTPALVSSSLYFIIAPTTFGSGSTPVSAFWPGYISIMNRMVISSLALGLGLGSTDATNGGSQDRHGAREFHAVCRYA